MTDVHWPRATGTTRRSWSSVENGPHAFHFTDGHYVNVCRSPNAWTRWYSWYIFAVAAPIWQAGHPDGPQPCNCCDPPQHETVFRYLPLTGGLAASDTAMNHSIAVAHAARNN
ncbi:MAG: hypothetical protein OXH23_12335 [bacterium]|nr:hypothetical protein [bacterium]